MLTILQIVATILIILVGLRIRRSMAQAYSNVTLILIIGIIVATIFMGVVALMKATLWLLLRHGLLYTGDRLGVLFSRSILWLIVSIMWMGVFPGSITALFSAFEGNRFHRIVRSCVSAITALLVQQVVVQYLEFSVGFNWFVFDIVMDLVFGVITGVVMVLINEKLLYVLGTVSEDYTTSQVLQKVCSIRGFWFFVGAVIVILIYSIFCCRIPKRVFVRLEQWRRMGFMLAMPRPPTYQGIDDKLPRTGINIRASQCLLGSFADTLDVSVRCGSISPEKSQKSAIGMQVITSEEPIHLRDLTLVRSDHYGEITATLKTIYNGSMSGGQMRIIQPHHFSWIVFDDSPPKQRNLIIYVPCEQMVWLSRDAEHFRTLGLQTTPETSLVNQGPLLFKTEDSSTIVDITSSSKLCLVFNGYISMPTETSQVNPVIYPRDLLVSSGAPGDFRIDLPQDKDTVRINPTKQSADTTFSNKNIRYEYPIVILIIGDGEGGDSFEFDNLSGEVEFPLCDLWIDDRYFGTPTKLSQFIATGIRGELRVQLQSYSLSSGDELSIRGKNLEIKHGSMGDITLTGNSASILLNESNLSDTIWSSLPSQVRAAIIGALIALAGALAIRFLPGRNRT